MTSERILLATVLGMLIPAALSLAIVFDAAQAQAADGDKAYVKAYDPRFGEGRHWNAVLSTFYRPGASGTMSGTMGGTESVESVIGPSGGMGMVFEACRRIGVQHLQWTQDLGVAGHARCINSATGDGETITLP